MDKAFGRLLPNPAKLATRLDRTGRDWTVGQYGMASAGLSFGMLVLLMLFGLPFFGALLLGLCLGLWVPHIVIGRLIARRRDKFVTRFPDAIELLVRGLRSGLPISETMAVVALELPGPVGEEFRAVSDRMRIGRSMDAALQETADRLDIPEFRFFVIAIAIQRETGGNLAETLSNLADVLRKRAQMKLKIKAMSSESKASAYIIGFLPFAVFGMIWMINQPYMARFFIDPRLMLVGGRGLPLDGPGRLHHVPHDQFRDLNDQSRARHSRPRPRIVQRAALGRLRLCAAGRGLRPDRSRDPMTKRVRALNERRELLKAGIDSGPRRRTQLIDRATLLERIRTVLGALKMLQDEQVKAIQLRLLQAGIRSKEMAFRRDLRTAGLPIVLGGGMALWVYGTEDFADWSGFSRYMIVAGTLLLAYKAPTWRSRTRSTSGPPRSARACPMRST